MTWQRPGALRRRRTLSRPLRPGDATAAANKSARRPPVPLGLDPVGAGRAFGLQHAHRVEANPQPKTSYQMLVPKGVLRYTLEPGETAVQPLPDKQAAPAYPASLVHANAAPVTVVAQLVMDKDGRVHGVYPVSDTAAGPDRALFEAEVEHAAMQWKFTPLWMQTPNGDGTCDLVAEPFSLWYAFQFKIVDGKPVVETVKR